MKPYEIYATNKYDMISALIIPNRKTNKFIVVNCLTMWGSQNSFTDIDRLRQISLIPWWSNEK